MAAPDGFEERRGSSPDLPVPWQNPWGLLWRDLGAIGASFGLRLRELWRLNREGTLWRPRFWPRQGASLFWPCLLVGVLALNVGVWPRLLANRRPPSLPITAPEGSAGDSQTDKAPAAAGTPGVSSSKASEPMAPESAQTTAAPELSTSDPVDVQSRGLAPVDSASGGSDSASPAPLPAPQPPSAVQPPPDALLLEFAPDDPESWIATTQADPGALRLDLQVKDGFWLLARSQRLARADEWQRRAQSLGYEDLRLLDGRGQVLGRRALVGSGMILLDFPSAPP